MNRRQLISVFFIALLLYILFNVMLILAPFTGPIFWSAVIAFTFYPLYNKLLKTTRENRSFSAGLITALLLLALTPLVVVVSLLALRETVHLYEQLGDFIKNGEAEKLYERVRAMAMFKKLDALQLSPWESLGTQLNQWLLNSAGSLGNFVLKHLTMITKNVIQALFNFTLTFFLVFFFFRDGKRIYQFIYEITPLDEDNKAEIFMQLSETFSATLRGQLVTSIVQGSVLGIVFWVLGLPMPVLFAAIAFFSSMVPIVGVSAVWVPFTIWLFTTAQYPKAVALLALGAIVISGIDNVLKPLVIGQKTRLPYSLLFVGILGGIQVYGFMGIFLAPVVLSLFFVLVKIYRNKFSSEAA